MTKIHEFIVKKTEIRYVEWESSYEGKLLIWEIILKRLSKIL